MTSRLHPSFRRDFEKLPRNIQERARAAYKRFQSDPTHPALQFKRLQTPSNVTAILVGANHRILSGGWHPQEQRRDHLVLHRHTRRLRSAPRKSLSVLTEQSVTIRDRDTLVQWRVKVDDVVEGIAGRVG